MEVGGHCWEWWRGGWVLDNLQEDQHQGGNHPGSWGKMREDRSRVLEMKQEDH